MGTYSRGGEVLSFLFAGGGETAHNAFYDRSFRENLHQSSACEEDPYLQQLTGSEERSEQMFCQRGGGKR